jgi:hypothetical protein
MEFDITTLIVFLVGLLFGLASQSSAVVQAFVNAQKARVPQEWHWAIDDVTSIAVRAAEQIWLGKKDAGKEKLDYSLNIVRAEAARMGITYDEAMLTALIEAKVNELFGHAEQPVG